MNHDYELPKKGDRPFIRDGNMLNACVGFAHCQWHGYIEGFKLGAEVLMHHVAEEMRHQDYLVYPIVFLYRQAIELNLKRVLTIGYSLTDKEPNEKVLSKHKLVPLWNECKSILKEVGGDKYPSGFSLDAVDMTVKEFEERDGSSTAFRYPYDLKGNPSQPNSTINLANFVEVAQRLCNLLSCCSTWFEGLYDAKCEIMSEYQGWD